MLKIKQPQSQSPQQFLKSYPSMNSTSKSISQIKRDNLTNKPASYKYIETMLRSGNDFKYNLNDQIGNYKMKLASFEGCVKESAKEIAEYKNDLMNIKTSTDSLKRTLYHDYAEIRRDINEEIDDFECKLKLEFNQQKIKHLDIRKDLTSLGNDLLAARNITVELKERISALQLTIHGKTTICN